MNKKKIDRKKVARISPTLGRTFVADPQSQLNNDESKRHYPTRRFAINELRLAGKFSHYVRPNGRIVKL